jgi:hypothetical protein
MTLNNFQAAPFHRRQDLPTWLYKHRYVALRVDDLVRMWTWPNWDEPWKFWGLLRELDYYYEDEEKDEQEELTDLMNIIHRRRAAAAL